MPKVSVIIPVYNVKEYLRECIDSVINQTLKDIEIICVSDGSTDNSLLILQEYAKKDNRIKIIDLKENSGLGNARNAALLHVTSNYVMFLDSDDWLELNACELAYNQISQNNNDFVIFGVNRFYEDTKTKLEDKKRMELFSEIYNVKNACYTMLNTLYFLFATCWYKIFNINFLRENNILFDACKFEDQIFNTKVYLLANSFSINKNYLYNYRIREGSISKSSDSWKDCIAVRKRSFEYILSSSIENKDKVVKLYTASAIKASLSFYSKYSKSIAYKYSMYKDLYELFILFKNNCDINSISKYINIKEFNLIINNKNFWIYYLKKEVIKSVFSVINTADKKYKIITIIGIKVKVKNIKKELHEH